MAKNLVTVDVLDGWLKSLDKAKAAHQSISRFDEDVDSVSDASTFQVTLDEQEMFQICDAYDVEATKRWKFQPTRKTFECDSKSESLPGTAKARGDMLRQRYWIVHQRLQRAIANGYENLNLAPFTAIESLTGSTGVKRVLGCVTQMEEGKWFLEDPKQHIELDFSKIEKSNLQPGFFTEGSIVIVEGEVMKGRDALVVRSLRFCPAEPKEATLKFFPSIDFFGAQLDHRLQERLEKYETQLLETDSGNVLLLSDVWLDDAKVFEKLKFVIAGADSAPPFALVLMGNFLSPSNTTSISSYIDYFERLAEILVLAPNLLSSTRIIFIPGPTDPTPSRDVFPSPALVKPIRDAFERKLKRLMSQPASSSHSSNHPTTSKEWPKISFTSNPVRLRVCTKQLVFFREDVTHKLRRHCFLIPSDTEGEDLYDHLVRTICDQSHLCPLPISVKPVFWNYDHAMRLYPLPDFVRSHQDI